MDDKIIVSNRGGLLSKYGSKGRATIRKALTTLAATDKSAASITGSCTSTTQPP